MIELLREVARHGADRPAVIGESGQRSYAELVADAEDYAQKLSSHGIERFAIVSNDIPVVVALLAAASLTGAEACVYAPDILPDEMLRQAHAFAHTVVISDRSELFDRDLPDLTIYDPRSLTIEGAVVGEPPAARPLLVLTTGTTGTPRGVRHDWNRQVATIVRAARDGSGQVWLLAYGPQQFAGLQVLLHVLGSGATLVAPPVRRPLAVLDAIHDHGVDHISATPTFWRFLLAELRVDSRPRPALVQVTLGGEAAPASLLADLHESFPDARISHVYAGSEFGSTGSVRDGLDGLPAALLDRGDGDIAIKIVEGELWVRSTAAMVGYYGEPDLPDDQWWPTGDLVEVEGERIRFRGRKSEVINVGGTKVHPLPLEERIAGVEGVRAVRVYGRPNPLVGAVVAVDVVPEGEVDEGALRDAVRAACADLPRPWQPRVVQIVAELAMIQGKIVRGTVEPPTAD
jgi:acyl-CoA synthetase (AMP-forming)/AMP-acid ligase II